MAGEHGMYVGEENCTLGLMEKPGEKRPLERTRKRRKHNINMDLQEIRFEGVDLVDVAYDRAKY